MTITECTTTCTDGYYESIPCTASTNATCEGKELYKEAMVSTCMVALVSKPWLY